ncbi:multicopper oxidase family protein [Hymenobacter sp. UV11]|uniref:multicopper oxidase family protein n=1 Tax=Hymenobacter sp. UV11 TaxID=1849735 RepID=UPI001414F6F3|nr:multicopper oxidase family protein [Hymenobacter sp. UV11]
MIITLLTADYWKNWLPALRPLRGGRGRGAAAWLLLALLSLAQAAGAQQVQPAAYNALYASPVAAAARASRTVRYDLNVRDTTWTIAGIRNHALATNGMVPSPTLTFTEGDTALIYLHNQTQKTVSFHWHGLLLPNRYDGVPMLTTELIEPGQVHEFKFALKQHGTFWYHSHSRLDEQKGQYGAIVIYPPTPLATPDHVVLLSDWTKENPWEVLRSLKRETDWYAIERGSVQSYGGALASGYLGTKLRQEWQRMPQMDLADVYYQADLVNGQPTQQLPDAVAGQPVRLRLINGSAASYFWVQFGGGKLRVVAADGVDVQPVAVDKLLIGTAETYDVEVTPPAAGQYELRATSWDMTRHTSLLLGSGPLHPAPDLPRLNYYQLTKDMNTMMSQMTGMTMGRAPAHVPAPSVAPAGSAGMSDMPGMAGMSMDKQPAMPGMPGMKMDDPAAKPAMTAAPMPGMKSGDEGMKMGDKKMGGMQMGGMKKAPLGTFVTGAKQLQAAYPAETLLNYEMLKAPQPTTIPAGRLVRTVQLYLTGNMFRYVWSINNKVLSNADKIEVKQGETVRFVLHNTTMMSHPMHLHGHFFRVLNGQGAYSPLKNTLSVAPMDMVTIEFDANEEKDWFFHCHLLYHLNSGMARIVHYAGSTTLTDDPKKLARFVSEDRALFPYARVDAFSQGVFAQGGVRNSYWLLRADVAANYHGSYETETHVQRYLGPKQFVAVYAGTDIRNNMRGGANTAADAPGQPTRSDNSKDFRQVACVGIRYFLPLLVWSDLRLDHQGKMRLQLERDGLPITRRLRADLMVNSDREYRLGSSYILGKYVALAGNYDSNYGWGAGLRLIY